ncbi:hypothetical protein CC1G_08447 [Coprinopsis cinerea okayama7|uniref:Uncharacterized protein n=1 Tax=Coprinopsis cinerea (strain Okayama-7 / 130 / ATCC MYA-4618 / FGSC 9003) TaxID=240176 RepID=A8NLY5_COPC7|nr:hypothetical protein CC1G_08447 [Coprinopsis cinerea okayama7\|eukprot:XP_001834802.1 hypothetical protein CC1G_08447 [Coprinopsis cinerea okayama7\
MRFILFAIIAFLFWGLQAASRPVAQLEAREVAVDDALDLLTREVVESILLNLRHNDEWTTSLMARELLYDDITSIDARANPISKAINAMKTAVSDWRDRRRISAQQADLRQKMSTWNRRGGRR